MSLRKFGRLVARVLDTLPAEFKPYVENLVVDVEEEPDERTLREQGFTAEEIEGGDTLYGLFCPFPLADGPEFGGVAEDDQPLHRIIVYRNPLEEDYPDPRQLRREIRQTGIHELAHHFGYTQRDLEPFESKEDPFGDDEGSLNDRLRRLRRFGGRLAGGLGGRLGFLGRIRRQLVTLRPFEDRPRLFGILRRHL